MTCVGASVHALVAVEQVRSLVPYVAHCVDVELVCEVALAYLQRACAYSRLTYHGVAYAVVVHYGLEFFGILVGNLNDNAGVLSHKNLNHVVAANLLQVDVHAALCVGEAHFEKSGYHTAGADVVTCHYEVFLDKLLNGVERVAEVFGILHCRNVVAYLAEALRKGTSAKALLVEREIDVIDA